MEKPSESEGPEQTPDRREPERLVVIDVRPPLRPYQAEAIERIRRNAAAHGYTFPLILL